MQRYLKLSFLLAGAYVRSRLQYRLSFWMMCIAIVAGEACMVGLLGALLSKFRAVDGWTLAEIVFLYGLANLAYSLMQILGSQLDDFDRYIVRGELDTVLIKPVPPLFYILASRVELHHAARALTSVAIFILALNLAHIRWSMSVAVFTVTTVLCGGAIMFALLLVSATVALWTTKSGKLTDLLITATKEAATFPISIYPLAVRLVLTFILPVAFVTYYPAQRLLQKEEFLGMPELFQFRSTCRCAGDARRRLSLLVLWLEALSEHRFIRVSSQTQFTLPLFSQKNPIRCNNLGACGFYIDSNNHLMTKEHLCIPTTDISFINVSQGTQGRLRCWLISIRRAFSRLCTRKSVSLKTPRI